MSILKSYSDVVKVSRPLARRRPLFSKGRQRSLHSSGITIDESDRKGCPASPCNDFEKGQEGKYRFFHAAAGKPFPWAQLKDKATKESGRTCLVPPLAKSSGKRVTSDIRGVFSHCRFPAFPKRQRAEA